MTEPRKRRSMWADVRESIGTWIGLIIVFVLLAAVSGSCGMQSTTCQLTC